MLPSLFPTALARGILWPMWSIHVHPREGHIAVNVNRWPSTGPYPVVLVDFELLASPGESELLLLERVAQACMAELNTRRYAR